MLLPDEWPHLRSAVLSRPATYGMSAAERLLLYQLAIETGLRAGELRQLMRSSVVLKATRPHILAAAGTTKNRQLAKQYVTDNLARKLAGYVLTKLPAAALDELNSILPRLSPDEQAAVLNVARALAAAHVAR